MTIHFFDGTGVVDVDSFDGASDLEWCRSIALEDASVGAQMEVIRRSGEGTSGEEDECHQKASKLD